MNRKTKILLVEDDPNFGSILKSYLELAEYEVILKQDGKQGLTCFRNNSFDLCILDIMMPEMDGIETCIELRKIPALRNTLIAFLTARSEDFSQIAGLDAGGDDYITKPIKPRVLISRINALLRRAPGQNEADSRNNIGDIIIDREKYVIINRGKEINLPRKEFELLELLTSKPNKVFTREEIFEEIWGNDVIVGDRTIDVHIRRIREKLDNENIKTIKGVGYKYEI